MEAALPFVPDNKKNRCGNSATDLFYFILGLLVQCVHFFQLLGKGVFNRCPLRSEGRLVADTLSQNVRICVQPCAKHVGGIQELILHACQARL